MKKFFEPPFGKATHARTCERGRHTVPAQQEPWILAKEVETNETLGGLVQNSIHHFDKMSAIKVKISPNSGTNKRGLKSGEEPKITERIIEAHLAGTERSEQTGLYHTH